MSGEAFFTLKRTLPAGTSLRSSRMTWEPSGLLVISTVKAVVAAAQAGATGPRLTASARRTWPSERREATGKGTIVAYCIIRSMVASAARFRRRGGLGAPKMSEWRIVPLGGVDYRRPS